MKVAMFLALALLASFSFALEIKSAKLDVQEQFVLIDVKYEQTCETPVFELDFLGCHESIPLHCFADLKQKKNPDCDSNGATRKALSGTVVFALKNVKTHKTDGLKDKFFKGASLRIQEEDFEEGGTLTSAEVKLP